MLNENHTKTLEELQMIRRQVELLESHRVVFDGENELNITPKQIAQAERRILKSLEKIEEENGIEVIDNSINGKLKRIDKTLNEIRHDLADFDRYLAEENYNLDIQMAIDEILGETNEHTHKNKAD